MKREVKYLSSYRDIVVGANYERGYLNNTLSDRRIK
jgi:hypothetical protein